MTLEGWKGYRPVDLHPARIFASVMAFNLSWTIFEQQSAFATRPGWREVHRSACQAIAAFRGAKIPTSRGWVIWDEWPVKP